jgi:hypothetical protein
VCKVVGFLLIPVTRSPAHENPVLLDHRGRGTLEGKEVKHELPGRHYSFSERIERVPKHLRENGGMNFAFLFEIPNRLASIFYKAARFLVEASYD